MKTIDLHVHSNKSDGSLSPAELVAYAASKNVSAIALTDHDTTAGLLEAMEATKKYPVELIPGIEFSTEYAGRDIHILGLFLNWQAPFFQDGIRCFVDSREDRNLKMCDKLLEAGIPVTYDDLKKEYPDCVITRAHYAKYMLKNGWIKSMAEAFERYIGDNCPCFVPRKKVTPIEAVLFIRKAGGLSILAHPTLYHMGDEALNELISPLVSAGLSGIEAIYSTYTMQDERRMKNLAAKYSLLISGGSDFHGSAKPKLDLGCGYGSLLVPFSVLENLKKHLPCERKLFAADLDGTLLNHKKEITTETLNVLNKMADAGHVLVLNSGRALKSILLTKEENSLSFPGIYVIAYNGGLVYDCDNVKVLFKTCLMKEETASIMKMAMEYGIYCHSYQDDQIISPCDSEELKFYQKTNHLSAVIAPDTLTDGLEACKCIAIELSDPQRLEQFRKALEKEFGDRFQYIYSSKYYLEIFPKDSGKGNALCNLCNYLGIPLFNALAAGDQENDISMIQAAGHGIAMANAILSLKEAADKVTELDNNHDGLVPELLEFFFGKELSNEK